MVRIVRAAGGQGSALECQLTNAREYLTGSAAQRREHDSSLFDAFLAVVAVDLASPDWSVSGRGVTSEEEAAARRELARDLLKQAYQVGECCDRMRRGWREASHAAVRWRAQAEEGRAMLRLVLRAWREVRDGVRAGTAGWEARWAEDVEMCTLARRLSFPPHVTQEALEGAWQLNVLLAYMRLVRAGAVRTSRRCSTAWQRTQHEHRRRQLRLSWEGAMPGERSAKYARRAEEAESSTHGVTSGAAAVRVRRAQSQRRQLHEQQQQHAPKKHRAAAVSRTDAKVLYCEECPSSQVSNSANESGSSLQPASLQPDPEVSEEGEPVTDAPAHLRSRWTDALLFFTPRARDAVNLRLGSARAVLPPDARLRDAKRPRGDG